jgi:hypothetical protein
MSVFASPLRAMALVVTVVSLIACTQTSGNSRGVVTSVDGTLDEVTAFSALVEGDELRFVLVEDGDYDFPLSHLREHQRTGEPVLVEWELVGSVRYALSLADG